MPNHQEVPTKETAVVLTHVRVRARAKFDERYRCECGPLGYVLNPDEEKCRRCGSRNLDYDHVATIDFRGRGGIRARLLVRESDAHVFLRDLDQVLRRVFNARLATLDPDHVDAFHDALALCDDDAV